jgi:RNA polymerase sigma factor (sigma-70 family)
MSAHLESQRKARRAQRRLDADGVSHIVQSAGSGDQEGWNALVREFGGVIRSVARAHQLNDAGAADVAQTTWLRLLEHFEKLKNPAAVGAWLTTTARRECLAVVRENGRHRLYGDDAPEDESPESPPGLALLTRERNDALRRGLCRLRSGEQALLRLLVAEPRLGYEEISAALDMPIGSIGPTRQRALERLRKELERQGTLDLMID